MEAHGHETIGNDASAFLRKLIQLICSKERFESIYIEKNYDKDHPDPIHHAMYLGNWLTDNSQLFSPDFFFEKKMSVYDLIAEYNVKINEAVSVITFASGNLNNMIRKGIFEALLDEATIKEITGPGKSEKDIILLLEQNVNSKLKNNTAFTSTLIVDESFRAIKFAVNEIQHQFLLTPPEFLIDTAKLKDTFFYDQRGKIWDASFKIIKLQGYRKFVKNKKMKLDHFIAITDQFIEKQSQISKDQESDQTDITRFHFKLNQYYPSDHLDRAFSINKLNQYSEDGYNRKADFVDEYSDTKNKREYAYLNNYLEISAAKLSELSKEWIVPTFVNKGVIDEKAFLLQAAKLGQTLHAVEDFFAHSNFLELSVQHIDLLKTQNSNRDEYYKHEALIKEFSDDERTHYELALKKTVDTQKEKKLISDKKVGAFSNEDKLVTGWFAEGGMATSLYHLAFGTLAEKANEAEYLETFSKVSSYLFEDSPYEPISEDIETLKQVKNILYYLYDLVDNPKEREKLVKKLHAAKREEFFSKAAFDYILNESSKKENSLFNDSIFNEYLRNTINSIIEIYLIAKEVKDIKEYLVNIKNIAALLLFLISVITVIFLPEMSLLLTYYIGYNVEKKIKEFLVKVPKFLLVPFFDKVIAELSINLVMAMGHVIESNILRIDSPMNFGSHSLIAKDEKYEKPIFSNLAIRTAIFMDQLLILALLTETKKTDTGEIQYPDFKSIINTFLNHPLKEATDEELNQPDDEDDTIWEKIHALFPIDTLVKSVYDTFTLGINSAEDLMDKFLSENLLFTKHDLTSDKVTISDVIKRTTLSPKEWGLHTYLNEDTLGNQHIDGSIRINSPKSVLGDIKRTPSYNPLATEFPIYFPGISNEKLQAIVKTFNGKMPSFLRSQKSKHKEPKYYNWIIHFLKKNELVPKSGIADKLIERYMKLILPETEENKDVIEKNDSKLNNIDTLKEFFDFFSIEYAIPKPIPEDKIINDIRNGKSQEVSTKVNYEIFLTEYYKKKYQKVPSPEK